MRILVLGDAGYIGSHAARLVASSEKAKKVLGWNPVHDSLEEIIQSALNWHKNHPNGYGET